MARRKTAKHARENIQHPHSTVKDLFSESNRGLLLDIFVFLANVLIIRLLSGLVIELFGAVSDRRGGLVQ